MKSKGKPKHAVEAKMPGMPSMPMMPGKGKMHMPTAKKAKAKKKG